MPTVPGESIIPRVRFKDAWHYFRNRPAYLRPVPVRGYADFLIAIGASQGVNYGRTKRRKKRARSAAHR